MSCCLPRKVLVWPHPDSSNHVTLIYWPQTPATPLSFLHNPSDRLWLSTKFSEGMEGNENKSSAFSRGLQTASCLCTYLHVSSWYFVDRICNKAYHLTQRGCSETTVLYLAGKVGVFLLFFLMLFSCWLRWLFMQLFWHDWIVWGWVGVFVKWHTGGPTH